MIILYPRLICIKSQLILKLFIFQYTFWMILYNITYNIEKDIDHEWLEWMKIVHIPKMMATGNFSSVKLFRLLNVEDEGSTFSLQFMSDSLEKIQHFLEHSAPLFAKEHNSRYKNKHIAFRTVLQELELWASICSLSILQFIHSTSRTGWYFS